ncbi:hypothetical protein [Laspinema palackyanum]|uniref:hypothetical protein n=1 Tax=Laspinema palackyanum TaxID=3231601 RepID=UPI00345C82EA|nr:hypothetical protein [Laspinema sp. D2c]
MHRWPNRGCLEWLPSAGLMVGGWLGCKLVGGDGFQIVLGSVSSDRLDGNWIAGNESSLE